MGSQKVAFHSPCTLQHGIRLKGSVEEIVHALGHRAHAGAPTRTCAAASAGTYSILQPVISAALRARKLAALEEGDPEIIATANIGCLVHLAERSKAPVRHWIELLDERMMNRKRAVE